MAYEFDKIEQIAPEYLKRLLSVIKDEILPKTAHGVRNGNKVFGAAVLCRKDLRTIIADTNNETKCPLFHGEVYVIQKWSEMPFNLRLLPQDTIFLSTHEPCCMCISAIVWAGFTTVFYLFPYETTRDQGIPHDLNIMHELWGVQRYRPNNKFCTTYSIMELVNGIKNEKERKSLHHMYNEIETEYNLLSTNYNANKDKNKEKNIAFD